MFFVVANFFFWGGGGTPKFLICTVTAEHMAKFVDNQPSKQAPRLSSKKERNVTSKI